MDLFHQHAQQILEVARMGASEPLSVLVHDNGPGLPAGLHLIMGQPDPALPPCGAGTAAFRVTRGEGFVRVRGAQGSRACDLRAESLLPSVPPFLLNNQALYQVAGGDAGPV